MQSRQNVEGAVNEGPIAHAGDEHANRITRQAARFERFGRFSFLR